MDSRFYFCAVAAFSSIGLGSLQRNVIARRVRWRAAHLYFTAVACCRGDPCGRPICAGGHLRNPATVSMVAVEPS